MMLNYIGHNQWDGQNFPNFYNKVISQRWDKIILFCQNEWAWHEHDPVYYPKLLDHCKNIGQKLDIITAANEHLYPDVPQIVKENTSVIHWDTYWLGKTYQDLRNTGRSFSINPYDIKEFKYYFVSMNHRPHRHRLVLIDLLAKHKLINETNAISIHHQDLIMHKWKHFQYKPYRLEPEFVEERQQYKVPDQYYESFAQLISEASGNTIYISEKTSTALILGKPFLIAGQKHFHKFLKQLGFLMYDEIFDYAFDDVDDEVTRYEMVLSNFIELQKRSLKDLMHLQKKIAHKIDFNKKKARNIIFDLSLYPKIALDVIEHYNQTGNMIDQRLIHVHESIQHYRGSDF